MNFHTGHIPNWGWTVKVMVGKHNPIECFKDGFLSSSQANRYAEKVAKDRGGDKGVFCAISLNN